jgi:hypothetical protein
MPIIVIFCPFRGNNYQTLLYYLLFCTQIKWIVWHVALKKSRCNIFRAFYPYGDTSTTIKQNTNASIGTNS